MTRLLVAAAIVIAAGCSRPDTLDLRDDPTITADLAVEGATAVVRSTGTFAPSPAPSPGDSCENCGGTGKLGDTTNTIVPCPACGGTGRKKL